MEAMSSGTSPHGENDEHDVESLFLEVVEQGWSGMPTDVFFLRTGSCASGGELSSGSGSPLTGDARCPVGCLTCCQFLPLLQYGEGCDGRLE